MANFVKSAMKKDKKKVLSGRTKNKTLNEFVKRKKNTLGRSGPSRKKAK